MFVNIRLYLLRVSMDIDVLRVHSCLRVLNAMQVCQIYVFPSYSLRVLLLLITCMAVFHASLLVIHANVRVEHRSCCSRSMFRASEKSALIFKIYQNSSRGGHFEF